MMESKLLISVIMCFLNAEKFIQEAIESVIHQTYDNWELLLVDDGSTDDSTHIAKKYTEHFSTSVRYLEHDGHLNKGLSASRNLAIKHAKGEYIAFLDSDDIWLPHNLEKQIEVMISNPDAAMVCGPGQYWYSWTGNHEDLDRDFILGQGVNPNCLYKPLSLLTRFLQDERTVPLVCCILVERELLKRVGGFEETFPGLYEDQVIFVKICIESTIFVHSKCFAKYRRHPEALCVVSNKKGLYHSSRLQFLSWVESYLLMKRIRNVRVWWVLKNELLPYRHPKILHLIRHPFKSVRSYFRKIIVGIIPDPVKNVVKRYLKFKTPQGLE